MYFFDAAAQADGNGSFNRAVLTSSRMPSAFACKLVGELRTPASPAPACNAARMFAALPRLVSATSVDGSSRRLRNAIFAAVSVAAPGPVIPTFLPFRLAASEISGLVYRLKKMFEVGA